MLITRRLWLVLPFVARMAYAQTCLNVNDFSCFTNKAAAGAASADVDHNGVINCNDFVLFMNLYAARSVEADCDGTCGWTDLTPPAGALVLYTLPAGSATSGCTFAAPCTLSRALTLARDGFADQVLLKCGEVYNLSDQITLTKSANSAKEYWVLGSYGGAPGVPRPKVRTPSHGIFGGNQAAHSGLAIVGLDLAPYAMTSGSDGIILLSTTGHAWDNVLIEDCYISGYSAAIVAQTLVDGQTFDGLKIRRCVIVDNDNNGGGHAQGIFLGGAANWLIEECVIDNNARSKADMFCHNLYAHELCGPGVFRGNISSRACSHGGQQRPGGTTENNLFLQNPINFYQGSSVLPIAAATNYFRNNVALDSRDINAVDRRGFGFVIGGAANTVVEYNVAAHQVSGTAAVTAFNFDGINAAWVHHNVVYDWRGPNQEGWATAYQWDGGGTGAVVFEFNRGLMPFHGMCVRHDSQVLSPRFTYRGNEYYTTNPASGYEQFSTASGVGGGWAWWVVRAGEVGSTFIAPELVDVRIGAVTGMSLESYLAECRLQSRQYWRPELMPAVVNAKVRKGVGM